MCIEEKKGWLKRYCEIRKRANERYSVSVAENTKKKRGERRIREGKGG